MNKMERRSVKFSKCISIMRPKNIGKSVPFSLKIIIICKSQVGIKI